MEASTVGGVAAGAAPLTMNVPSEGRPDFCIEVDDEDDSQLLHDGVGQVQEQNNRLLEVFKKTQQNLQTGANVLLDLRRQREQLRQAGLALEDTDNSLTHSNRLMRKIFQRMAVNRAIYIGILVLLGLSILVVVYRKF